MELGLTMDPRQTLNLSFEEELKLYLELKLTFLQEVPNAVGFTGTRKNRTPRQEESLRLALKFLRDFGYTRFVHGGAFGADLFAHDVAWSLEYELMCYPALGRVHDYVLNDHILMPTADPLTRNGYIVNASRVLIAMPHEDHEILRSGTWSTVRRARRAGIPRLILYPTIKPVCEV